MIEFYRKIPIILLEGRDISDLLSMSGNFLPVLFRDLIEIHQKSAMDRQNLDTICQLDRYFRLVSGNFEFASCATPTSVSSPASKKKENLIAIFERMHQCLGSIEKRA